MHGTFILERLLGTGTYCLLIVIATINLSHSRSIDEANKILKRVLVILTIMAFFYVPAQSADLFRWRQLSVTWPSMSLSDFIKNYFYTSSTPLGYLLIYICQKTGIEGVLPATCAFLFFMNIFHIIISSARKLSLSQAEIGLVFLFVMCTGRFLETISGVRSMVAFSIITRCICDEYIQNKSILKTGPFYIIACLIHSASIPLVAIRLFVMLFESERKIGKTLINIIVLAVLLVLSVKYGDLYISSSVDKAYSFINNNIYSNTWEYLLTTMQLGIIIDCMYKYYRLYRKESIMNNSARLLMVLSLVEIIFFRSYSIFHRFVGASSIIAIPLLGYVLKVRRLSNKRILATNITIVCLVILVIAATRGNLSGYKFFVY